MSHWFDYKRPESTFKWQNESYWLEMEKLRTNNWFYVRGCRCPECVEYYFTHQTGTHRYREYIWGSQLADVLKRNGITPMEIVRGAGIDEGRIYRILKQRLVSFDLADRILSAFGLGYMLATDEIEVFTKRDLALRAA